MDLKKIENNALIIGICKEWFHQTKDWTCGFHGFGEFLWVRFHEFSIECKFISPDDEAEKEAE